MRSKPRGLSNLFLEANGRPVGPLISRKRQAVIGVDLRPDFPPVFGRVLGF